MQELGIKQLKNRVLSTGSASTGASESFAVSGGERQRVSIAMELVTSPPGRFGSSLPACSSTGVHT